ncbi:phosphatidylinositol 4-kinase-like protein [Amylocarpus encephaloides]|uniref:1-phosphatidylinositol 4-kinase n=1 Tax=Amylocarpus encephaloides TaxID=45428 RepID=A0A9P7YMC1_9HELO|nr:phosphatidylinositol 4-kinase-like protein [Amylocarpus encephaloides]
MDSSTRNIRRKALEKIAALSATSSSTSFENSDLDRLSRGCASYAKATGKANGHATSDSASLSGSPMSIQEFEVLLALCKAAPLLSSRHSAEKLMEQLSPYILEAHTQVFGSSPYFRDVEPSPIEALSYNLSTALLTLGISHPHLRDTISERLWGYLRHCVDTAKASSPAPALASDDGGVTEVEDAVSVATIAMTVLGFLDAAAAHANFWTPNERLLLVQRVKGLLSEEFLVAIETAFSTIRSSPSLHGHTKEWKRYVRHYAAIGRPLGAMLLQQSFMWLLVATSSLLVADVQSLRKTDVLDIHMSNTADFNPAYLQSKEVDFDAIEAMADIASDEMSLLEDGADYLRLGSTWQQRLAFSVKAATITSYLNCSMLNEDAADADALMAWLEDILADPAQMADETLASVVLRSMALISKISPGFSPNISRVLPRFIVQGNLRGNTISLASQCLAFVLRSLSQDAIITTLYTFGNVLSSSTNAERALAGTANGDLSADGGVNSTFYAGKQATGSSISLPTDGEEEASYVYGNVVETICGIASSCNDPKITALAQSMLLQKLGKVNRSTDARIIREAAGLALSGGPTEFRTLLKLYAKIIQDGINQQSNILLDAVTKALSFLSSSLRKDTPLYDIYLEDLLEAVVSKGDVHQSQNSREADVEIAAREISQLLQPLAIFMSHNELISDDTLSEETLSLFRDAWFNVVVHGFTTNTDRGKQYIDELRLMAIHSKPIVGEGRGEQVESDIELNTVLRRGMSPEHEAMQKKRLTALLPAKAADIRGLSYRKVIFLQAAYLVETLRGSSGDCTKAPIYFIEPGMRKGDMSSTMEGITGAVMDAYLKKTLSGTNPTFSAPYVAEQLARIFNGCCYRIERVQQAAMVCADQVIREVPSALCQKSSLFALLELLTIMWTSCLEAETDEYEWKSSFSSARGGVSVELSDDYSLRRRTLNNLYKKAKVWVSSVISIAPLDVKGLLQTYLSEYNDEGAYGHISLGRSFANEMGSTIPSTDQRLSAIDRHGDCNINTASDFIAQYTTRQEYRYAEALPDHDAEWLHIMHLGQRRGSIAQAPGKNGEDAVTVLAHIESRTLRRKYIPIDELRDILRRAAALLCRSKKDECAIVHHLVAIPFGFLTKQSIKLGISLWLGVINENPRMESRILMEVAQQWESTVHRKLGIFNCAFLHPDPFYVKGEFAPSDRSALSKRQQTAHNLLQPHMRLLQFLTSHFNATRLGTPHVEKSFLRLLNVTLDGLMHATGHPLAREIRFQVVLFGIKIMRHVTALDFHSRCLLKDKILSAALSWFTFAPRWSFGGNRVQIKAETRLLADVALALKNVQMVADHPTPLSKALQTKEALLQVLIESEHIRLNVWLYPLGEPREVHAPQVQKGPTEATLVSLIRTAWNESPSLAIQLITRFPSPRLHKEIRCLVLNFPDKAVSEPEAVQLLLGETLPNDISFQLKYLLYWAPVNPITAVTLFLPAYRNHPFILQYAMRALESHSVDVTFFYVPQIVQTLRYDVLGYVERYIVETAKFSQLFAHQIIWNMKANAYKDEDSQIPDDVKPTLDKVMARMIKEFSEVDKDFYEREFDFFDEVTSISGKLKPLIKRPKPERKQKIEEELRKIKVDVGVYLPSNPDGIVIGIDRKSGKPLQSHAKAPYMATFRIKKPKGNIESTESLLEEANTNGTVKQDNTVETWQSAIFKVGDDCRQDVLALQMIAAFRGIFNNVGLDVYVFPYRVTATAPGCGVIDVLPNSISRDMVGREAVNGLYDYFVSKYGNEDSLRFQEARSNFVKSMAAYSIISFLLQFKDRHNGNIMIDDAGHILHIDFGFCFDIAPGGVKFERAPFKLTTEMVAVMGGGTDHQAYKWFEELCVKAFLASRPYVEKLSQLVLLMMDSGLPCFKLETIQHFKERFVPEKSEKEAADFMRGLIKRSQSSYSTGVYDQFQLLTNGIPY